MCGIIGYAGEKNAASEVLNGLRLLEYRGYDSAGMAAMTENGILVVKKKGRVDVLAAAVGDTLSASRTAIGHTRWATHGEPSDRNSHPHGTERVMLVHNGIIENDLVLKERLLAKGYVFESDTDTEVAAKLIDSLYEETESPVEALRRAASQLCGSYAFAVLFEDIPDTIYAMRCESPLLVGVAEDGAYLASDIAAFLPKTRKYIPVENREILSVCQSKVTFYAESGEAYEKKALLAEWDIEAAERGGFESFMEKEMHEEPRVTVQTLSPRIVSGLPDFSREISETRLLSARKIWFIGCGTAYHAGLFGKFAFEKYAGIPAEAAIASEFRYAEPLLTGEDAVILISQSGETADTLAALRLAKDKGAYTIAVVNVGFSTIARESDAVLQTFAGPEIAVASTKAYTVQTALLLLLSVSLGMKNQRLSVADAEKKTELLSVTLPKAIEETLMLSDTIRDTAKMIAKAEHLFFIGRNQDYISSLEGSLKLKEISYIHSEAYAAGELKHGTISLVEEGTPVVALSTVSALREKLLSNLKETLARGARAAVICEASAKKHFVDLSPEFILLPDADAFILPIVTATALQLLAFHTASLRGCDVDKPRNLAKSVTVE